MGDRRVTPTLPFVNVRVDFADPITLHRGHVHRPSFVKAYICLFVCISTNDVCIELVLDLFTDFLAAFRRFIARLGKSQVGFFDNDSTVCGATNELKELYDFLDSKATQDTISKTASDQRICWNVMPAQAHHLGGIWNSAFNSAKTLLEETPLHSASHCRTILHYSDRS